MINYQIEFSQHTRAQFIFKNWFEGYLILN